MLGIISAIKMKRKIAKWLFLFGAVISIAAVWPLLSRLAAPVNQENPPTQSTIGPSSSPTIIPTPASKPAKERIDVQVHFVSQAPFGDWDDPRQQDGCEEVSSLMAVYWAQGKVLSRQEALGKIIEISGYEEENHGEYRDTSAEDTLKRIIKGYFDYQKAFVREINSWEDIYAQLEQGRLVIVPMNGQKLKNPNYTAPGPARHMIVVRGYDPKSKEFITNDPGTRKGEKYRYPTDLFFEAIRDYPSGYHQPIVSIRKVMIVVER